MALDIAKAITNNKELVQKNVVNSAELRQLVTQELQNRDESTIAESYSGYNKNKVTTEIREEITSCSNKYNSKAGRTTRTHAKQFAMDRNKGASRGSIGRQRMLLGDHNDLLLIVLFFSIEYLIIGSNYLKFYSLNIKNVNPVIRCNCIFE